MKAVAEFPCEASAVAAARHFVAAELDGLPEDMIECAQLLTSELATNAILHARTPFSVLVEREDHRVRVEVGDRGDGGYQVRPSRAVPGGHGLFIVRSFAYRSGFESRGGEHVAWFVLEHASSLDLDAVLERWAAELASAPDLRELLARTLAAAIELTRADFGNVQLVDDAGAALLIAEQRGFDAAFLEHFARVDADDSSACGQAIHLLAQVAVRDVATDPSFAPHLEVIERSGFRAVLSTPLLHDGRCYGVVSTHYRHPRGFPRHELLVVRRLADLAAPALAALGATPLARDEEGAASVS